MCLRSRTRSVVILVAAAMACTSCGARAPCDTDEAYVDGACRRPCVTYRDCGSSQLCASGVCVDCRDSEGDGVCDDVDNCAQAPNTDQLDGDRDGAGDACDFCTSGDDGLDGDGDGIPDACDRCPAGDDGADEDQDGVADACDQCPAFDDAYDTDLDGVADACDRCQGSPDDLDGDGDRIPDGCEPRLIGDLSDAPASAWIDMLGLLGGVALFTADDGVHGSELWRSDGTPAGTYLVADLHPNHSGSPRQAVAFKNLSYFIANTVAGSQLWRTDGTTSGTQAITDGTTPGPTSVLQVWAGATKLYLLASDAAYGNELWVSDGTAAGSQLVADFIPNGNLSIGSGVVLKDVLYFTTAIPGASLDPPVADAGWELWRTDGTLAGTRLVGDICPGSCNSSPYELTVVGDKLFFIAWNPTDGQDVWVADAQSAARITRNIDPGSPSDLEPMGGMLFFATNETATGRELWASDGTLAGTRLVKDIIPGPSSSYPYLAVGVGGRLFFTASEPTSGQELWTSDGTAGGTNMVKDLYPGATSAYPSNIVPFNNGIAFRVAGAVGAGLWYSDGTPGGTVALVSLDLKLDPSSIVAIGRTLLFLGTDDGHGRELWQISAPAGSPALVRDINLTTGNSYIGPPAGPASARACFAVVLASETPVYCTAGRDDLWRVTPVPPESPLEGSVLGAAGGTVYLVDRARRLWKTDGRHPDNTLPIGTLPSGQHRSTVAAGEWFYGLTETFGAPTMDVSLWRTNGTETDTTILATFPVENDHYPTSPLAVAGDAIYFVLNDWTSPALVRSSISTGTTEPVTALSPGLDVYELVSDGTRVYFRHQGELWQSDGTAAGTGLVADLDAATSANPSSLTLLGAELFFAADDGSGRELWRTRGTAATTIRVADLHPTGSSNPSSLVSAGGLLFFTADDGSHGVQLWRSDGSAAGTFAVSPPPPALTLSTGSPMAAVNGVVYVAAATTRHGTELWRSDGTRRGTYLEADLNPGPASSYPTGIHAVGGVLLFSAADDAHGQEPWVFRPPQ